MRTRRLAQDHMVNWGSFRTWILSSCFRPTSVSLNGLTAPWGRGCLPPPQVSSQFHPSGRCFPRHVWVSPHSVWFRSLHTWGADKPCHCWSSISRGPARGRDSPPFRYSLSCGELLHQGVESGCVFGHTELSHTCGNLDPQPGIELAASAVKVLRPNHWTTREFPKQVF